MTNSLERTDENWLSRAAHWLRSRGEAWAACRELDNCGEAARLAADVGISLADLRASNEQGLRRTRGRGEQHRSPQASE